MDWVDRLLGLEGQRHRVDSQVFPLEVSQEVHHLALQDEGDHPEVDHVSLPMASISIDTSTNVGF